MRISIRTEKRGFSLIIPLFLIINPLSIHLVNKYVRIEGLGAKEIRLLVRELKQFKKSHGRFDLVEIESHDHLKIKITV